MAKSLATTTDYSTDSDSEEFESTQGGDEVSQESHSLLAPEDCSETGLWHLLNNIVGIEIAYT